MNDSLPPTADGPVMTLKVLRNPPPGPHYAFVPLGHVHQTLPPPAPASSVPGDVGALFTGNR